MHDSLSPQEFDKLSERWDPEARRIIGEREVTGYARETLEHFSQHEAATMAAALERLIPQREAIDLVGFIDWAVRRPLGRGDRRAGMPDEETLFHLGLEGLDETALAMFGVHFAALDASQRDTILSTVQRGESRGAIWDRIPSPLFFASFYAKALHGYFAHPRVWRRIGFMGPAYPEGYLWMSAGEVRMRHERRAGWDLL